MKRFSVVCISWLMWLCLIDAAEGHRVHRVHNIVLYPERHSWCTTFPIKQVISFPGCKSEEIDNNVCVGACFSYSIPHTEPSDPGEVIVPYCDSCQPSETTWHNVTLGCDKEACDTPHLVKSVQIINNCSCSSCDKSLLTRDGNNPTDFSSNLNDVPELLNVVSLHNETNITSSFRHNQKIRHLLDHKIITLVQNIRAKNSPNDKVQLIELLKMMYPEHDYSNEAINEFVDSLIDEHNELDMDKLKEVLHQMEHKQKHNHDKHKKYNHNSEKKHHEHHHGGNQSSADHIVDNITSPHGSTSDGSHSKLAHHSGGIDVRVAPISDVDDHSNGGGGGGGGDAGGDSDGDDDIPLPSEHHHGAPSGHHVVGDTLGHGHLIKGPRGALVIDPGHNHGHEKLDVNPHELKPNNVGTMVSYASPSSQKIKQNSD